MRKIFISVVVLLLLVGCSKYSKMEPIAGNTYLRVFNTITNYDPRGLHTNTTQDIVLFRTLCILIDPQQDASGRFTGAATTGDFLGTRPWYSGPYETHPNEDIGSYGNTEWPGAYRVQTGGIVNGLDLSRWARVPSGKHRLIVLRRMPSRGIVGYSAYFDQFTAAGRDTAFRVAIDTTLQLDEQSIYTMELVSASTTDAFPLRLLLRKETLDKDDLSDTASMYVNFYNYLESSSSPAALDVYYQNEYVVNTTSVTPVLAGDAPKSWAAAPRSGAYPYDTIKTPEKLLTTIAEKFSGPVPYAKIAMPPVDSFYYTQGQVLGQYRLAFDRPHLWLKFYLPGQSAATGAKPYTQLLCDEFDGQNVMDVFPQFPLAGTLGSLYQTVTSPRGVSKSFPMVTTLTLTSTYSQINKISSGVQIYQASLQRPAPANLIQ